jgi:hypothetical protein
MDIILGILISAVSLAGFSLIYNTYVLRQLEKEYNIEELKQIKLI